MSVFFNSLDKEAYPDKVKFRDIFGKMVVSSMTLETPSGETIGFTNTDRGEIMLDKNNIVLSRSESPFSITCPENEQMREFSMVPTKNPEPTFLNYRGVLFGLPCTVEILVED